MKNINISTNKDYFIPLGGCGEFGMNMSSFICHGTHILIDTGVIFPDSDNIGIDGLFPSLDSFFESVSIPDAILITHGHEDHIGAFSYIISKYPSIKVYTSEWTKELLLYKLLNNTVKDDIEIDKSLGLDPDIVLDIDQDINLTYLNKEKDNLKIKSKIEKIDKDKDKNKKDKSEIKDIDLLSRIEPLSKKKNKSQDKTQLENKYNIFTVSNKEVINIKNISVEFIFMDHSIPQSFGVFIKTPSSSFFHTGDFKFNKKNFYRKIEAEYLLVDSTSSGLEKHLLTEKDIFLNFKKLIDKTKNNKILITTFSSNFQRICSIIKACNDLKRHFTLVGSGLLKTIGLGIRTKLITEDMFEYFIPETNLGQKTKSGSILKNIVIIASGCQAERMSAFSRIIDSRSKQIKLSENDVVVFSSRTIPGREKAISKLKDKILKQKAIYYEANSYHTSGHASREDIISLIKEIEPKCVIPIHGAYCQLHEVSSIAKSLNKASYLIESGNIIEFGFKSIKNVGEIDLELNFIDSFSNHILSKEKVRERIKIASLGLIIFYGVFSFKKNAWVVSPSLDEIGLLSLDKRIKDLIFQKIEKKILSLSGMFDINKLKEELRIIIRSKCERFYNKKPVVLVKLEFNN